MSWKILLVSSMLFVGCVSAKLSSEETTVTVIGEADVRVCHEQDQTVTPTDGTLVEQDHCVEIDGEGISEHGASVFSTLLAPVRWVLSGFGGGG